MESKDLFRRAVPEPSPSLIEAMDTLNSGLVRRCFRILNPKIIGLTITPADITARGGVIWS